MSLNSRAILEWARQTGTRDPSGTMAELAESLRDAYFSRNKRAIRKPPYLAEKMAPLRRIIGFVVQNIDESARLEVGKNGFLCVLSYGEHRGVRRNFSIAHELGHTEFYDIEKWPPTPLISPHQMGTEEVERLCHRFAECLLIPQRDLPSVQKRIAEELSFDTILRTAHEYQVSLDTLVRRLDGAGGLVARDRFVAILRPTFLGGTRGVFVSALAGPSGEMLRLPTNDISLSTDTSLIMLRFGGQNVTCDLRTRHFGSSEGGYKVALGYLETS